MSVMTLSAQSPLDRTDLPTFKNVKISSEIKL